MKGRFLKRVVWYTSIFEAGKVYDLDDMVYAKLLRQHIIEVEQPEEPKVETPKVKPVVTSKKKKK
jgi:hypothetical protein